jgi:aryl-alcohol dehydrogenase-like predicted oxidoreductase
MKKACKGKGGPWNAIKNVTANIMSAVPQIKAKLAEKRADSDVTILREARKAKGSPDFDRGGKRLPALGWRTLADEVKRGRIGAVGVSNYSAAQMREAHQILAARGVPLAVNQVRYSLLTRQIEGKGISQTARDLGVTILAYSPLAQGLLTGKYTPSYKPQGARSIDPRFSQDGLNKIAPVLSLLREIGEKYDRTPAQVSLNWLIAQGNVIPIAGVKTAEQVKQNAGALGWKMTQDEIAELEKITRPWLH